MHPLQTLSMLIALWPCSLWAVDVQTGLDPVETVRRINASYNAVVHECKEADTGALRGHYYCSGVTLRMVNDGNFEPWDYSPYAVKTGATSFSWIRRDLSINTLIHPAGFIIRTPTDAVALGLPVKDEGWTCIYPFDAGTGPQRGWYGCGKYNDTTMAIPPPPSTDNKNAKWAFGTCAQQQIETVEQWKKAYPGGTRQPIQTSQCSWNAESPAQWETMIRVHESRATTPATDSFSRKDLFDEFMLANATDTADGDPNMKYIDAFVYQANTTYNYPTFGDTAPPRKEDGRTSARNFQRKLHAQGYAVPVLNLDFKRPPEQRFQYIPADQVISLNGIPPQVYIASATWAQRLDPGTGQMEWTLNVVPTALGKSQQASQREAIYQELLQLRGGDSQWRDGEKAQGSMKQQLNCIITHYPQRVDWNLEPFRPVVSDAQAKAAGCNPALK
ncbi:putative halovibrin [Paucimonas lemoignei]|nr:putative halovibrin [Paucimonas lemoignei]